MDRRRFLKHAGATAAVTAVSALGLSHLLSSVRANSPPVADFSYKPKYLVPSADQPIQFTNLSISPDGNPLTFVWSVDGNVMTNEKDFSAKLSSGQHQIHLNVSDGNATTSKSAAITVEPDQLTDSAYQQKPLYVKYKGVRYFVGKQSTVTPEPDFPEPTNEEMDEQLTTIHDELGCNAITICGGLPSEDRMIQCALTAIDKGFDKIYVQPGYLDSTVDETIDSISKFAPKVKTLRDKSNAITLMVGHEFQIETVIVPGSGATLNDRWKYSQNNAQYWNMVKQILPPMFSRIVEVCKNNYGYPITYAATPQEARDSLIPWSNPAFESVGVDAYITDPSMDEKWMGNLLNNLKQFGKPIIVPAFGMESYAGADKYGGSNPLYIDDNPYDEEPQARYIVREVNMFNQAGIDGCFWGARYNDKQYARGHALYNPQTLARKKGFYMYKSYQRVS